MSFKLRWYSNCYNLLNMFLRFQLFVLSFISVKHPKFQEYIV